MRLDLLERVVASFNLRPTSERQRDVCERRELIDWEGGSGNRRKEGGIGRLEV